MFRRETKGHTMRPQSVTLLSQARASGKAPKGSYFRPTSRWQADIGLGRKCEPNPNLQANLEMCSIRPCMDRQKEKTGT